MVSLSHWGMFDSPITGSVYSVTTEPEVWTTYPPDARELERRLERIEKCLWGDLTRNNPIT